MRPMQNVILLVQGIQSWSQETLLNYYPIHLLFYYYYNFTIKVKDYLEVWNYTYWRGLEKN